jgi:hypothetical protein
MTEWSTDICSRENYLSANCCYAAWLPCCSYGVLASQLKHLNKATSPDELEKPFKQDGYCGADCFFQYLMIEFCSVSCPLLCAKRCEIRRDELKDKSCGGAVKDCVFSWMFPCCSSSQVRSTQHASQRTSPHSFYVARPCVSSTDICQIQMMNQIDTLRQLKFIEKKKEEAEKLLQTPGTTAADASIFLPILKKETSVFEQIVM